MKWFNINSNDTSNRIGLSRDHYNTTKKKKKKLVGTIRFRVVFVISFWKTKIYLQTSPLILIIFFSVQSQQNFFYNDEHLVESYAWKQERGLWGHCYYKDFVEYSFRSDGEIRLPYELVLQLDHPLYCSIDVVVEGAGAKKKEKTGES